MSEYINDSGRQLRQIGVGDAADDGAAKLAAMAAAGEQMVAALNPDGAKPSMLASAQALEAATSSVNAVSAAAMVAADPSITASATQFMSWMTNVAGLPPEEAQARAVALFTGKPPPSTFPWLPVLAIGGAVVALLLLKKKKGRR